MLMNNAPFDSKLFGSLPVRRSSHGPRVLRKNPPDLLPLPPDSVSVNPHNESSPCQRRRTIYPFYTNIRVRLQVSPSIGSKVQPSRPPISSHGTTPSNPSIQPGRYPSLSPILKNHGFQRHSISARILQRHSTIPQKV